MPPFLCLGKGRRGMAARQSEQGDVIKSNHLVRLGVPRLQHPTLFCLPLVLNRPVPRSMSAQVLISTLISIHSWLLPFSVTPRSGLHNTHPHGLSACGSVAYCT